MNKTFAHRLALVSLLALITMAAGSRATAQETLDSVLRPPKGAQMAIVVFEDLQCPMCRRTAPVMARFFDTHSKQLGNEFRDYIFENQMDITPQDLRGYAEKFATAHKVDLPFIIDPNGKLAAEVNADRDLGKAIKLDHTPTVYIVSSRNSSKPYVEVKDNNQLYSTIDAMMKE